jgi:hypothetical protein
MTAPHNYSPAEGRQPCPLNARKNCSVSARVKCRARISTLVDINILFPSPVQRVFIIKCFPLGESYIPAVASAAAIAMETASSGLRANCQSGCFMVP